MKKTFIIYTEPLLTLKIKLQTRISNQNLKLQTRTRTSMNPRPVYDVCGHSLVLKLFENMGEMKFLFQ